MIFFEKLKNKQLFLWSVVLIVLIVFLDQLTKNWAVDFISEIIEKTKINNKEKKKSKIVIK